jgi:HK97 family phage major capsid protein
MTLESLIAQLRSENAADAEKRAGHSTKLAELRGQEAKGEDVAVADVEKLRSKKANIDARVELRNARIAQLEADLAADKAAAQLSTEVRSSGIAKPAYDGVARVGQEERSYHPGNDPKGHTFIQDVAGSALGNWEAREKLQRHMVEERMERKGAWQNRATSTGSFVGLTVPQYLTDFFAPQAKAMRPFAEVCRPMDLPSQGMVVNISRITTGSTVAVQATQNNSVSNQDMADTLLTIPVQTLAAQQTMSRQAIERSTGAEEVTLDDLLRQYNTTLDNTLINQATTGLSAVANPNTFTASAGAATVQGLYAQIMSARSNLESVLLDTQEGDQVIVMHSRRWASIMATTSANNYPFVTPQGGGVFLTGGTESGQQIYGPGYRGTFGGLAVIVDNNIATNLGGGTNQDEIYVVNRREAILWEDSSAPVMIRAEQTNAASLGVLFVLYGYFAYTTLRYQSGGYSAQQKISGTGLVTPSFSGSFLN